MPLVYTQVVHLAVYVYFAASLVGEQWIIWKQEGDEEVDLYYPVFMTVRWEAQVDNRRFFLFQSFEFVPRGSLFIKVLLDFCLYSAG